MSIRSDYFQLSQPEFKKKLADLKNQPNTIHLLKDTATPYFFYDTLETQNLILELNKAQYRLDTLIQSFSSFTKNQIIQSFLLSEIDATNKIENIYSTRHDIFSVLHQLKTDQDKKIDSIVNSYTLLFQTNGKDIVSLADIRTTYDQLFHQSLEKENKPDGTYFRKGPVYITDGIKTIHKGIQDESQINKAMEEFLSLYHSSLPLYERMILSHFLIEKIHPYYDGNGRLGRFLFSNGIYQETHSPISFLTSTSFIKDKNQYYKAFKDASDRYEFGCINLFVMEIGKLILDYTNETIQNLEEKKQEIQKITYPDDFTKSEIRIYTLIKEATLFSDFGISNEEILTETKVSKRTLIYTLNHFKDLNLLQDTKFGRFTYHRIID